MNLIEQLGGYDKAKEMYIAQLKAGLAPYGYEEALLEYRRANNIFEVGDKVVKASRLNDDKVYQVFEVADSLNWVKASCGSFIDIPMFKHATDEEIQAGRRLSKIKCWSCDKEMSHSDRAENDGFCIHCNAEIEL